MGHCMCLNQPMGFDLNPSESVHHSTSQWRKLFSKSSQLENLPNLCNLKKELPEAHMYIRTPRHGTENVLPFAY